MLLTLEGSCCPPPFDHSKLMVVDGHWVLLGSANWDARALRLNFELNVDASLRPQRFLVSQPPLVN